MLQVENLSKHYGDIKSVTDLSFSLSGMEIVGLLGENGAGKSTTMNMLTGCLPQTAGKILFEGVDTAGDQQVYKSRIGYLPEIPPLYPDMTVAEQLEFVCAAKGIMWRERQAEAERVSALTNITHMRNRLNRNLSKGYKQRVGLAQALIGAPSFLVLDEPMAGLDPRQISEMRELIVSLGMTVLISSHILPEISMMCSRLLVLKSGRLVADAATEELLEASGMGRVDIRVRGRVIPEDALASLPDVAGWESVNSVEDGCLDISVVPVPGADIREELFSVFAGAGVPVLYFEQKKPTLEDIFIQLIS